MSTFVPVRHGRLTIHAPPGWTDDTTVNLVSPPIDHGVHGVESRCALVVSIEEAVPGLSSAEEFLRELGKGLQAAGTQLRDLSVESFVMGGKPGALADREVTLPDAKVRQLMAAVIVGKNVVLATASADVRVFDKQRATLRGLLERLQID